MPVARSPGGGSARTLVSIVAGRATTIRGHTPRGSDDRPNPSRAFASRRGRNPTDHSIRATSRARTGTGPGAVPDVGPDRYSGSAAPSLVDGRTERGCDAG